MKRLTTEEFIERARRIHGNKYDYSKVEYVNAKTKICIICPIHGEFWQTPDTHLNGGGCFKCAHSILGISKRLTTEEFNERSKIIHSNKYDTSKVKYVDNKTKVCIICPIHGEFWQNPASHLQGYGCPKCRNERLYNERNKGRNNFVKDAIKIHGDKYDYSKVVYINSFTKVCIICSVHGEFWQTPANHLSGKGCPKCGGREKLTTEELKKRCEEIYGDKITLEKVKYKTARGKIIATCSIHGDFEVTPDNLLHGHGCSKCKESKLEQNVMDILEKNKIKYVYQKRFSWLGKQSLDFYLPEYNIAIECQGIQHYKPIDFAGKGKEWANKLFEETKRRDSVKFDKVKENGIKMLYINEDNKNNFLNEIL